MTAPTRSPFLLQILATSVDEAPGGIAAFDTDCRFVLWNRAMESTWGVSREQALGKNAFEVFPFLKETGEDAFFHAALRGEHIKSAGRHYSAPGGTPGAFDAEYSPIRDDSGAVIGGVVHVHDCSGLQHEAGLLETILATAETVTAELDLEKVVQAATDAATRVSGAEFGAFFYNVINERGESYMLYTISGVPRERFSQFPMPRNTAIFAPTFAGEGIMRSGDITKHPLYGKNAPRKGMPDGHLPVRSYLALPVKSRSGGEVFGGLFFGHSQPDRFSESHERLVSAIARQAAVAIENARLYESERRARERAEQSEAKISTVWSSISDAFIFLDRDWRYVYANQKACELPGKSLEELLGKTVWDLFPGAAGSMLERELHNAMQHQVPRHFEHYFESWNKWFDCHAYPSAEGMSLYFRDVTTEKRAKESIEKAEERLKFIASTTNVGTWYCDLPFDVLQWSPQTKDHFWLPPDATVTIEKFYERLHPEDREKTRTSIAESIAENGLYDIDYRTVSDDGRVKWIRAIGRAAYDRQGKPISFDGVTIDYTERRAAEEALRRTERLATAGRLAATVAHEVNNPLEAVTNLIYLCQVDPEASESIRSKLKLADDELRRVAHIVRQTLGFYRETSAPQLTRIAPLVKGLVDLYRKRFVDRKIDVLVDVDDALTAVIVPGAVRQVVANLLSNALDACAAAATVVVSVRRFESEFQIRVSDTGQGISEPHRQRLFEPFFTTKADVGTGLGLWVSKSIVESHGGKIKVDSSTGPQDHGTTFTITLPMREELSQPSLRAG
jgi:PAS domain S-box-containing protein